MMTKHLPTLLLLLLLTACAAQPADSPEAAEGADYQATPTSWQALAEQGDPAAQTNLGTLYSKGDGVDQDDALAVEWYRKAAEQGFAPAQHNLGLMYAHGRGVAQDNVNAYAWLALAVAQQHPESRDAWDSVTAKMSDAEVVQAQTLAQDYYARYVPQQ